MIRAVVFDLWNTLVHSQHGDPFKHIQRLLAPEQAGLFQTAAEDAECFPEAVQAVAGTRKLARVALLSNTQSFDLDFLERLGLTGLLATRMLSAELGFLKPDIRAFRAVQRRLGLFPGEIAMVGDSWRDDVAGALEAGWTAIWVNRAGLARPPLDPEALLVEIPELSRVPEAIANLQAGARCGTCLG